MTVRVNKSSFNIREKLSELGRKFGLKGSELAAAETVQEAREIVSAGRKNLVINGDMRVAQRATSQASVSSTGYYTVDRFQTTLNNLGTWTVSRESDAPDRFQYSLKHTCTTADASPAASDYALIYHRFETQNIEHLNYGSSAAQDVTLSFWVKSNKTGSASVGAFFAGGGDNRFINKTYTINNSGTWEHKTVTFKGNTEHSFDAADNASGLTIEWWMNSGSGFQGNTENIWTIGEGRNVSNLGVGGATSDYFSLAGVQLEVGRNATEFEHRSIGEELALCQRYFIKFSGSSGTHGTSSGDGGFATLANWTASAAYGPIFLGTEMREPPALGAFAGVKYFSGGSQTSLSGSNVAIVGTMTNRVELRLTGLSNLLVGGAGWARLISTSSYINFDAEL